MTRFIQRMRQSGDTGSALVAAIGVAVVGIALSTIVVSQAIIIMNDAARDRVRTVEIHAAEAALDNTLKLLENETPCAATMSVSEGTNAVDVAVNIDYYDGVSPDPLVCDPDTSTLSGTPVRATVTSHATPTAATPVGVRAERKIQATVNLVPMTAPSMGAAIFAGSGGLEASNSGKVVPLDPALPAQVWIEGTNWQCSNSYAIEGDVVVTDGSITMSNTCRIKGNAWAKSGYTASNSAAVEGDLVVYNGNLGAWNTAYFGGDVSIGGVISDVWTWNNGSLTVVGDVCSNNIGGVCGTLPLYEAYGLAEVRWDPDAWVGFTPKSKADFGNDVVSQLTFKNTWAKPQYLLNPCRMDNTLPNPVKLPAGNAVYDLRTCDFSSSNTRTIEINGDVAIFAKSFTTSNQFTVVSGDGLPHELWFIVPDGGVEGDGISTCASGGNISFSNQTNITSPVSLFVFTPCNADISNNTNLIGQIYGGKVKTSNNFTLLYTGMGIPGVDLGGPPTTVEAGYSVEIVNKREISN